jgi:hypothetical protein
MKGVHVRNIMMEIYKPRAGQIIASALHDLSGFSLQYHMQWLYGNTAFMHSPPSSEHLTPLFF